MIWKIVTNLREAEEKDWLILSEKILGKDIHSDRKKGFSLSREALREAFRENGFSLSITEMIVQEFQLLPTHPEYIFSLSHSKHVGAAVLGDKKRFRGLGIDVENSDRIVSEGVLQRILNQNDPVMPSLELWCVKEAVFKAIMNSKLVQSSLLYSDVVIEQNKFSVPSHSVMGGWKIESTRPYVVACAWIDI